jgi:putative addiction module antidote
MKLETKKIGNSTGFIIPHAVATRLGIEQGKTFFLTEMADGSIRLSPYDPDFEETMAIVRDVIEEYRDTFHALAK